MNARNTVFKGLKGLTLTGTLAVLVACGGSGGGSSDDDSSSGASQVVARGVITQLGSIYVNGVKYETPNGGTYDDDDSSSGVANYQVGQVVSIRGSRSGATGRATKVEYEAEIEGAADANGDILGINIVQTPKTNAPGIPATLANGQRYEVSGIWIDDTTLEATFIKLDDDGDGEDEIKGHVKNLAGGSFGVRSITFNGYSGTPALADGDFVEVHFNAATCTAPPNVSCTLTSVELEDDYFDQARGLEIEIEGAVELSTTGCPPQANFKVDGVCVDSSSKPAQWLDGLMDINDLVNGTRVEAEGHMVAGTPRDYLRADKVKGRGNRVRVTSIATNVNTGAGTFNLLDNKISVTTKTGVTQFEAPLTINNIAAAASVEVRGVRTGPNSMLAIRIKDDGGLSGGGDRHELRAEVDLNGTDTGNNTMTVMGIVSLANSNTELEVEDVEISPGNGLTTNADIDAFLGMIDADSNAANGPRDVVEIGVDITTGNGSGANPYVADEWEIEEEDD